MTLLLASVADLEEMKLAFAAGADILDLKNPRQGVLGAWQPAEIMPAVGFMAGRRPLSAAAGDATGDMASLGRCLDKIAATGVDVVKFALGCDGRDRERMRLIEQNCCGNTHWVAVIPADLAQTAGFSLHNRVFLADLVAAGCRGVMVDTWDKTAGRLFDILTPQSLAAFIKLAGTAGLEVGLAGSLQIGDVALIRSLSPDIVGFRGAFCEAGQRGGRLSFQRVRQLRARLYECASFPHSPCVMASQATATAGAQIAARSAKSVSRIPKRGAIPI